MPLLVLIFIICSFSLVAQPQVNLGNDTLICDDQSYTLDAGNPGSTYLWSTDETTQQITVYESGTYSVTVTDSAGNKTTDEIEIIILNEKFNQTDHWMFGNQGHLHFKPKPGSLPSDKNFPAGSASISSPTGTLQFYTNGGLIYDRTGAVMLNGEGQAGDPDYRANSIIVPEPGSAIHYYVFTIYPDAGLYYSLVDIQGNGGKGEVITKNIQLDPYAGAVSAVRAADNKNIWLISHNKNTNTFYSYFINQNTVNQPKISQTGPPVSASGQIKVSPTGDKVAITDGNFVHIYKFVNGQLNHTATLEIPGAEGVEFSRASTNLFVSTGALGGVYHIDVSPLTEFPPVNQIYQTPPESPIYIGDLQMGIDGTIYAAQEGQNCLGAILKNNNDDPEYQTAGICLEPGATSTKDLPPFPQHYFKLPSGLGMRYKDTCQSFPVIIHAAYYLDQFPFAGIKYHIDFGDGTSIDTNYLEKVYDQPGSYKIKLTVTSVCHTIEREVTINIDSIPDYIPMSDTILCRGETVTLDPSADPVYAHSWSNGATTPNITVGETGNYEVAIKGTYCSARDTAMVTVLELPDPAIPEWDFLCREKGEILNIEAKEGEYFYWYHSGQTSPDILVDSAGIYVLLAENMNGCKVLDTMTIENICDAEIFVPDIFTPNGDGTNDIFLPKGKYLQAYELRIYNRWGELIFVSKDRNEGWDGYYRGRESETGAYGYVIIYESKTRYPQNNVLTKAGHVILAR